jgi:hypothetical protein
MMVVVAFVVGDVSSTFNVDVSCFKVDVSFFSVDASCFTVDVSCFNEDACSFDEDELDLSVPADDCDALFQRTYAHSRSSSPQLPIQKLQFGESGDSQILSLSLPRFNRIY